MVKDVFNNTDTKGRPQMMTPRQNSQTAKVARDAADDAEQLAEQIGTDDAKQRAAIVRQYAVKSQDAADRKTGKTTYYKELAYFGWAELRRLADNLGLKG